MKKYTARNSKTLKYLKQHLGRSVYSKLLGNSDILTIEEYDSLSDEELTGTNPLYGLMVFCISNEGHDYWWAVCKEFDKNLTI